MTKRSVASAIATGTLLFNAFATSAFAGTTLQITGNGANSDNTTTVTATNNTTVTQSNNAVVTNVVDSNASTGGNTANANTGGNVSIGTGNATTAVDVSTRANANQAVVNNCNCLGNTDVTISGNGANSANNVDVTKTNNTNLFQDNAAVITNVIDAKAKTGGNDASANTGGNTAIRTGNAASGVAVDNAANMNVATVGSALPVSANAGSSLMISGNGAWSDNSVSLDHTNNSLLVQGNSAYITNLVDADAKSGGNTADANTGGNVHVNTGNAQSGVLVENAANFNFANLDCGCVAGLTGKIAGNGTESYNDLVADLTNNQSVFHENAALLTNDADANAKTGYNDTSANVGSVNGDPSINTGFARNDTIVSNEANMNVYGSGVTLPLPGGTNVNFGWNFSSMWAQWMNWM